MKFIPSLELSRMLYEEHIQPIMQTKFPDLKYAAATSGMCSENFGLDDEVSMDHEWGPRVSIYLPEHDQERYAKDLMTAFHEALPPKFKGFDMMWRKPGVDVHNTSKAILYHVGVGTVTNALMFYGGITALPFQDLDWLRVSEQHLLEFTNGVVYRDDVGELTRAREQLAYYPDNVLKFLLASEWGALGSDWFPIGRIGTKGDQLGLHLQSAKIAQRLMRIGFMVSRKYFHYKKWCGSLFMRLPIAAALQPILLELMAEQQWQKVEEMIGEAAVILLQQQNKLKLTPPISMQLKKDDGRRHHMKHDFWHIANQLSKTLQPPLKAVMDKQVFFMQDRSLILWNEEIGKWSLLLQQ